MRGGLALGALLAVGCVGDGTGTLSGTLFVSGCTQDYDYGPAGYDMNPTYFVADPINALASDMPLHPINKLEIRMQPTGNRADESDVLFVNVADDAQVAAAMGAALPIGATTNVRVTLTLHQTCPDAESLPEIDGTITWMSFGSASATEGIQFGDRLAATFSGEVVDRRAIALGGTGSVSTAPAVSGHLDGSFDFIVRQGKAAQPF
jgi:hypothetical protein